MAIRLMLWVVVSLLLAGTGFPGVASAESSRQSQCRPDVPCLAAPRISEHTITVAWAADRRYSFFRVSVAVSGGVEIVKQTAGGNKGEYGIGPLTNGATYTLKVTGCVTQPSGPAHCTPWSDPQRVVVSADGVATLLPAACNGGLVVPSFKAAPDTITLGDSTTLSWGFVENASRVEIDNGIGGVATPGQRTVTPDRTTPYRLTATGCGGDASRQATVKVNVFTPNQGFPASTENSPEDFSSTLEWFNYPLDPDTAARIPGGVAYDIEIHIRTRSGKWKAFEKAKGYAGDIYRNTQEFPSDTYQVRFRARARSKDDGAGLRPSQSADWTIRTLRQ